VRRRMWIIWGVCGLAVFTAFSVGMVARAGYESAPYKVVESAGNIEIREYPDLILASTNSRFAARGNDGSFMKLFQYISGSNAAGDKIEMTTPVFMEPDTSDSPGRMGFVMPQQIASAGAPAPRSADVSIRTRTGGRFAVIRFSGVMDTKKADAQEQQLREWLKSRGLEAEGVAERAGYDPPFTPGPLRRNEVLIRLKSTAAEAPAEPAAAPSVEAVSEEGDGN